MFKLYRLALAAPFPKLIGWSIVVRVVVSLCAGGIAALAGVDTSNGPLRQSSVVYTLFVAVIFAPLFETLVFQVAPVQAMLRLTGRKIRHYHWWAVLVSALLFGLPHCYSLYYIIHTFFIGIVLAWLYVFALKSGKQAFGAVVVSHACMNLISFLIKLAINA